MFDVVVFEGPDMLAEFGGVSVFGVAESVPYFRTTIYFSFMLTDISLCACYLFTCARVRFIF